jgi:hypothetical protein
MLDPAILFFLFGIFAGAVRSNLEIPQPIAKFLSLYLLMALGLKGGFALAESGWSADVVSSIGAAMVMAILVPVIGYTLLSRWVSRFDAVAVSAAYGSVSAVTFVTAMQYLEDRGLPFGGHMTVAMVLMESPAIIFAVVVANVLRAKQKAAAVIGLDVAPVAVEQAGVSVRKVLRESFTDGAHLLLLGSLLIGYVSGEAGRVTMQPFTGDLFKGMLAFFLLDMGLMVARNFSHARRASPVLLAYAALGPQLHAGLALCLGMLLGLSVGETALLMVLSASASYIVVPAVLRYAIPEANPALYFGLGLGVTFPINILVGIPLYVGLAQWVMG